MTLGLIFAGTVMVGAAPTAAAQGCIGYVYDFVDHTWHCIPQPGPLPLPPIPQPPQPPAGGSGCVAYVYVYTQGWTCVPPQNVGGNDCLGYVWIFLDPTHHYCIPAP